MKTFKERHQFYLPDDLSEKLELMAKEPGSSKTAILTDALRAWFERRAANELDERFGIRLDRISQANERLERKLAFVAEALGTFVQHQLTVLAHQPPFDQETGQLGLKRYRSFVETVGRRLARPDQSSIAIAMSKDGEDTDG
jgi:predicted transcriptional regulator